MRTFVTVTLLLVPLSIYLVSARLDLPLMGAIAGFVLAVAGRVTPPGARLPPPL